MRKRPTRAQLKWEKQRRAELAAAGIPAPSDGMRGRERREMRRFERSTGLLLTLEEYFAQLPDHPKPPVRQRRTL
jgi:hypothetical protein